MLQLAIAHAIYYLLTGLWPLVHIRSFLAVTGPKTDLWLVRTVGVLVSAIGLAIAVAAWRGSFGAEIIMLAIAAAAGLTGIDVVYVARRVIAPIYLIDVVPQFVLIIAWAALWWMRGG